MDKNKNDTPKTANLRQKCEIWTRVMGYHSSIDQCHTII